MMKEYKFIEYTVDFNKKWISKDEFKERLVYLREKEKKYINILIPSLNYIHNRNMSNFFWKKNLGPNFRRMVDISYDAFIQHSQEFNLNRYTFTKMNSQDYTSISDFEHFRDFFTNQESGYNQLFSQYMDCFYPDIEGLNDEKKFLQKQEKQNKNSFFYKSFRKITTITFDKIKRNSLMKIYNRREPLVLILGSYFNIKYLNKLLVKSKGRIQFISNIDKNISSININRELRESFLKEITLIEDDFDKFFFYTLLYNFPTFLLENFENQYKFYNEYIKNFSSLKYIICENWISDTSNNFLLSIAKENYEVKHIYNEHNTLFHQVLGTGVELQICLVDIYYTLGWNRKDVIRGASLFFDREEKKYEKRYDILYVSGTTFYKRSEWNAAYSQSDEGAHIHISFVFDFFNFLEKEKLNRIVYRGYPVQKNWKGLDKEKVLKKFKEECLFVDNYKFSATTMMKYSSLVIMDYFATAFLESLIMDIPTILFWNPNTYFLNDEYSDFFNLFVECGIVQTSAEEAAIFINNLNDVNGWWSSDLVQNTKKSFLKEHMGNPEDAIQYYLNLVK